MSCRRFSVLVFTVSIGLMLFVVVADRLLSRQQADETYRRVQPKKGERCIICDVPLTDEDITLIVRGRRVPLKAAMVDSFMNNQEKYFSRLQPKGALVQENLSAPSGVAQGGIGIGWFLFGMYVLIALVFGGMSGYAAVAKGLPPVRYFFIGLVSSVFGYLYVMTRPAVARPDSVPGGLVKVPSTTGPVSCSQCGYTNHPSANQCGRCGTKLNPSHESETSRI